LFTKRSPAFVIVLKRIRHPHAIKTRYAAITKKSGMFS
jgi:hypothetical protein